MTYTVPQRVYRTTDGRLVGHNDPDAAFLAHPEGEQLGDDEAKKLGLLDFEKKMRGDVQDKQAAKPANKAVEKSSDKEGEKDDEEAGEKPAEKPADRSAASTARAARNAGKQS